MTPFEDFIKLLASISPLITVWLFIKLLFLVAILIYLSFAVIVIKQTSLMTQSLEGELNLPMRIISWVHLAVTVAIFILALVIL